MGHPEGEFAMKLKRFFVIVATVLFVAFFVETVLFGGCGRTSSGVQVSGIIVDSAGVPMKGVEVYSAAEIFATDDKALAMIKADVDAIDPDNTYRERPYSETDSRGHYTLFVRIGGCSSQGPIATTCRAIFGTPRPSRPYDAIVARARDLRGVVALPESGEWATAKRKPGEPWRYEMPTMRMPAK